MVFRCSSLTKWIASLCFFSRVLAGAVIVLLHAVGQGFSDHVDLCCSETLPLPQCVPKGQDALGPNGSCWVKQGLCGSHGPSTECSPSLEASGVSGQHRCPGVWSTSGSCLVSKKLKLGLFFHAVWNCKCTFCDDYFKIALLLQRSPHYLSIFHPNPSPGWVVQVFSVEEIMRM